MEQNDSPTPEADSFSESRHRLMVRIGSFGLAATGAVAGIENFAVGDVAGGVRGFVVGAVAAVGFNAFGNKLLTSNK